MDFYDMKISEIDVGDHLEHHGILGQRWGVRRYQNYDGTLTEAGKKRYQKEFYKAEKKEHQRMVSGKGSWKGPTPVRKNIETTKRDIFQNELSKSKEFKDYVKRNQELEKYENEHGGMDSFDDARYAKLRDRVMDAERAYNMKIISTYTSHEGDLLSARLKDLNLPDNIVVRNEYKNYKKNSLASYTGNTGEYDYLSWL